MAGRPAHRPSRRASVIDAAVRLFATYPAESVTVADIAAAADMTAAAVYYHFPSKERILLEGLQAFTREYLGELRRWLVHPAGDGWAGRLVAGMLAWCEGRRVPASVYFARSAGVDLTIEALRRETRIEQVVLLSRALRDGESRRRPRAEVGVAALGLVCVIETTAASWLTQDAVFLGLGRRRFLEEAAALSERIACAGAAGQ